MRARTREKDPVQTIDQVQGELELIISDAAKNFFASEKIKDRKLTNYVPQDILSGALITVFTKHLAFLSAQEEGFDHETYLQGIFDAMSQLFAKSRKNFVELLKDKGEKNSSAH